MKKYKKPQLIAKNSPQGSYAAGCPEKGTLNTGDCKRCERKQ